MSFLGRFLDPDSLSFVLAGHDSSVVLVTDLWSFSVLKIDGKEGRKRKK